MTTIENRIFTFLTGHTIKLRDDYNPRVYEMIMRRWDEDNPPPPIPEIEKEVPVKGGTRKHYVKNRNDPEYKLDQQEWQSARGDARLDYLHTKAIDRDSIDTSVVEAARAYAAQDGYELSHDDLLVFLETVITPSPPGTPYAETEQGKFYAWIREAGGPSEALIDRIINTFRAEVSG